MKYEIGKIYNDDFLNNGLPDKSVQLIIADPPYFEVKGEFDFIWPSFDAYLADVEKWAKECKRILADNGTLFWYGDAKRIAYSQIILDRFFNLENSIVWRKIDSMQYQYYSPDLARSFNTHNERILMYSNEVGMTGLEKLMEENIKPNHPFAAYLREEFNRAGVTAKEIAALFPSKTGGLTGCVSNWLNGDNVITEEQYNKIRAYLNGEYLRKEYEDLRKEYEDLRKEYEDLRKEYEDLRRYFYNPMKYEEVFEFSQEGHTSKNYDHDTVKPEKMTRAIITTCSRPGGCGVLLRRPETQSIQIRSRCEDRRGIGGERMKELAIGETGLVDGVLVKCVEWDELGEGCSGCVFYNDSVECGTARPCTAGKRKDKKNVKFRPIELCTWTEDPDGIWHTSCEHAHEFTTGTPGENDHLYCPYCGKVLDVSRQPMV